MPQQMTVIGDNLTVDLILYRRDGRRGQDLVEETYALNPGLADLGPVLPVLTVLTLPDPAPIAAFVLREPVSLFD